jgi:hypothetical protein
MVGCFYLFIEVMANQTLSAMARASDIFAEDIADLKVKEVKNWLQSKGVRSFEPVSLYCDQLKKVRLKSLSS